MAKSVKNKLMEEYVRRLFVTFRILEVSGFSRFIIRNGKIVARGWLSKLYNMFIVLMIDLGAITILYTANLSEQSLSTMEFGAIVHFWIFSNFLLLHITFGDENRGPDLMKNCIELDSFLGAKETEFMRILTINIFKVLVILVGFSQVGIVVYLYCLFEVPFIIHVIGSIYFFWLFFAYDEFCFFLFSCMFLSTRAQYLNVALLKVSNMKIEYIPKQLLFHNFFWKDEYNDRVTFHNRAQKDFSIAFKILFNQLRHIECIYRFPITLAVLTVMLGSFVTVQTFIMYIEASSGMTRASVITSWAIATWFYILVMSLLTDMFYRQIEQTKFICAYIQLKPSSSEDILKLTKDVIATLEVRDPRVSIYDIVFFDTGLIFKVAASTLVYITVQLQLAFPNLEDMHKVKKITKPAFELDHNAVKEFLFLY